MEKYIEIIQKQALPVTSIEPVTKIIHGTTKKSLTFKVEHSGQFFMYKVSTSDTSFTNLILSRALHNNNIPAPDSKIFASNNCYFEKYKFMPGQSVAEALQNNKLTNVDIEQILHNVLVTDRKISKITLENQTINEHLTYYNKHKKSTEQEFGKMFANLLYIINKKLSTYGNIALHHADLNSSNILLDEHCEFKALIDLDGLALCNEYTMLSQILFSWPNLSIDKLAEIYESAYEQKLNKRHMKHVMRFKTAKAKTVKILRKCLNKIKSA